MGISRQERPQMFRRVIFDRVPEVRATDVVHDDAPAPVAEPPRPRSIAQRPTLSILHRPPTTSPRDTE